MNQCEDFVFKKDKSQMIQKIHLEEVKVRMNMEIKVI